MVKYNKYDQERLIQSGAMPNYKRRLRREAKMLGKYEWQGLSMDIDLIMCGVNGRRETLEMIMCGFVRRFTEFVLDSIPKTLVNVCYEYLYDGKWCHRKTVKS